jgi:hypothetical protein
MIFIEKYSERERRTAWLKRSSEASKENLPSLQGRSSGLPTDTLPTILGA